MVNQLTSIKRAFVLAFFVLVLGCSSNPSPTQTEWPQTCEMCGTEWIVIPNDGQPVPPTIEWCLHDGVYCEEGFAMVIDAYKNGQTLEQQWIDHCKLCQGCRCASFSPAEWAVK